MSHFYLGYFNPNDDQRGNSGPMKRKQFAHLNQHYISHNAVLPTKSRQDFNPLMLNYCTYENPYESVTRLAQKQRRNLISSTKSPNGDRYKESEVSPSQRKPPSVDLARNEIVPVQLPEVTLK